MAAEPMAPWWVQRVREHAIGVELRDYQEQALAHVAQAVGKEGKRRIVVVLATGGGKTVVFGALANTWLSSDMGRVLVLAHRDELIRQAVGKMGLWIPRHLIGVVKAAENTTDAPVVVASVQTLCNPKRLAQVGRFGLIVIDEAHHAAAKSYRDILEGLRAFDPDGPVVVGVTATPQRGDGVGLDDVFEDIVYKRTYSDLVARGWLVPHKGLAFDVIPTAGERPKYGMTKDYDEGWLGRMMLRANAPAKILEAWQQHGEGRPTLVFTPVVSVAKAVAEAFNAARIPAGFVSGSMPIKERRAALDLLRTGDIKVLANCAVLTEGYDEPKISCVVVARPTTSESLYIQMVGRGTRCLGLEIQESRARGKHDLLIMDMVSCSDQLTLDAVADLGGKKSKAPMGNGVSEPAEELNEADVPFEVEDGVLVARAFKSYRSICRWVELPGNWFALSMLADGWITLEPDDEWTWTVMHRPKRGKPVRVFSDLALELAKSAGETAAKERSSRSGLPMVRNARWLDRPISDKQLMYGLQMGLPVTAATTAWEKTVMDAEREYRLRWAHGR